jgi:hypothetical protein
MEKEIIIGSNIYKIDVTTDNALNIMYKIIDWMEQPNHYAASSGEGIMQSDDTIIDAPELISDIVDNILKPKFIREEL